MLVMQSAFKYVLKFSNSVRHTRLIDKSLLWKKNALTKLSFFRKNLAGRNNTGVIVARFRGSRARKRLRVVSNIQTIFATPGTIFRIEYDPNRSAFISLVVYANGVCLYTLHTQGLFVGDIIVSVSNISRIGLDGFPVSFHNGDSSYLLSIPNGTVFHALESVPSSGGVYARSAGTYGILIKKFLRIRKNLVKLPSSQLRSFSSLCSVVKGIVSNDLHDKEILGSAGINRLRGKNPIVRGICKNPIDHPHGGGEGHKSKKCFPRTAWGKMLHWRKTGITYINMRK